MLELHSRLYIGDQSDCTPGFPRFAVVHACKAPCHQQAVGYGSALPPDHRYYLALEDVYNLYLNLIDPPTPLFQLESFRHFFGFMYANAQLQRRPVLIHCNQGNSRAPSLALLYLAKVVSVLPDDSYAATYKSMK
jgi:protein-tyrosine phosphatase